MDPDICRWIAEFLLRNTVQDHAIKKLLQVLPVRADSRFKKMVLLRTIQADISDASFTEATLDNLETMEQFDRDDGTEISDLLKAAYCAVAVECTVKCLRVSPHGPGKYFEVVKRIFRDRSGVLEKLGNSELVTGDWTRVRDELEAAIWDANEARRLLEVNTRNRALEAVRVYLEQAWALMDPPFLVLAAVLTDPSSVQSSGGNAGGVAVKTVDRIEGEPAAKNSSNAGQHESELTGKNVNLVEEVVLSTTNWDELATKTVNQVEVVAVGTPNVGMAAKPANQVANGAVGTPNVGDLAAKLVNGVGGELVAGSMSNASPENGIQQGNVLLPRRKPAVWHKRYKGGLKITDTEEVDTDLSCSKYDSLPTREVNKVLEALKSSSLELQAVVKDPLPDALRVAETLISDKVTKDNEHEPSVENQSKRHGDPPNPSFKKSIEPAEINDCTHKNQSCIHQGNAPQPGLMERNSTAHTYEWDSIEDSPEGMTNHASRLHLPSPRRNNVLPLKTCENEKSPKRRKIKRWSLLEEDTLRTGVQKYGKGNWKLILNCYREIFEERTEVDLKDKWRNMTRS